ncbi:hypothetical protein Y032_0274g1022 [Ancylostoma ceylanicum]|uniref:Uncharacterized protein n=1 Tax=Ancylostoma ceylanicum TaxID=53326 RepID=A0A016S8W9_9BILA|nr:hypothetical protein Y032_0274g1022 [Ancylostoma ceylanicum]
MDVSGTPPQSVSSVQEAALLITVPFLQLNVLNINTRDERNSDFLNFRYSGMLDGSTHDSLRLCADDSTTEVLLEDQPPSGYYENNASSKFQLNPLICRLVRVVVLN